VGGFAQNWITASFSDPETSIRVFSNIDHPLVLPDLFQWQVWGFNGTTWDDLFDPETLTGDPSIKGNAKILTNAGSGTVTDINNVVFTGALLTNGVGTQGSVGFITDIRFSQAYSLFAFGVSDAAVTEMDDFTTGGALRQEISAVTAPAVPLPGALSLFVGGLAGLGVLGRLRKRRMDSAQN
jgi:hypothetical protein